MDSEYKKISDQYKFQCKGCKDNCCLTKFYHHTYIEYFYLLDGFKKLEKNKQDEITNISVLVDRKHQNAEVNQKTSSIMCPLNYDGLCILYEFRPMICRLHGIPNELNHPIRGSIYSPGCANGNSLFINKGYLPFDRTPYYRKLAKLEKKFRENQNLTGKIKKTVAQMLQP